MFTDLLAARTQMAVSLGFHIIFACIGMTMPFFMAFSHAKWLRSKNPQWLLLTKAWSKGVAIFFATGAVSGTVLSFELGLLWPTFMKHAGGIIGMPFSWEGTAFFLEAIALGLFLYGWDKMNPWLHWLCGVLVGVCGVLSGLFVVCANAWMNSPAGFEWTGDKAINIDPWAAMFNPASLKMGIHMIFGAFQATGFAVAGLHGLILLKQPHIFIHRKAIKVSLFFAMIFSVLQPLSGDFLAKQTAKLQPLKLAAMESHFETEPYSGLILGGIPDLEHETVPWSVKIPGLLSFLAHGDFETPVKGLNEFPRDHWPPVLPVHLAFQVMVGIGSLLLALSVWFLWCHVFKKVDLLSQLNLRLLVFCIPLGFIAVEAGWMVTELGRQPWIIYNVMKTADALTPMPGLQIPLILFSALYLFITGVLIWLMKRQIKALHLDSLSESGGSGL